MKNLKRLSNAALFASLERLARSERRNLPEILGHLAELSGRGAEPPGFSSLFAYCTRALHWSEGETAKRIQVARAASRFPVLYLRLWKGQLTLSGAALLAPHLTRDNHRSLIKRTLYLPTRDIEGLVAGIAPRPEKAERIRTLGAAALAPVPPTLGLPFSNASPSGQERGAAPAAPPAPTVPSRVEFTFTVDESLAKDVEDARALLRNKYPFCRLEDLFREAVRSLLDRLDPARRPAPKERPGARKAGRRRVPPALRAFVWKRDKGRCAYVASDGTRCTARAFLEFDHIRPFALGGPSDDAQNLRLLCRSHNMQSARRVFGFI